MASPAKKPKLPEETLTGYIQSVSTVKLSRLNSRYFEASLQTGHDEYRRLVCFSVEKRPVLVQASESKHGVKLIGVRKSVSFGDTDGFDVLMSTHTVVEVAQNLPFFWRERRVSQRLTIQQVLRLGPRQSVGEITVKVMQVTMTKIVPLNGVPAELRTFEICDPTGQTALTLWNRQIVEVGEGGSYRFGPLSTRKDGPQTVLTGTPSTTITPIAEVRVPASYRPVAAHTGDSVRGTVTGVQILAKPRCRRCQGDQTNLQPPAKTHRCERCGILQRLAAFNLTYSGIVIINSDDGKESSFTVTHAAVFNYVRDNSLMDCAHEGRVIEEHLIASAETEVKVNSDGLIVGFVHPSQVNLGGETSTGKSAKRNPESDESSQKSDTQDLQAQAGLGQSDSVKEDLMSIEKLFELADNVKK